MPSAVIQNLLKRFCIQFKAVLKFMNIFSYNFLNLIFWTLALLRLRYRYYYWEIDEDDVRHATYKQTEELRNCGY
jgi:hypothetical protein